MTTKETATSASDGDSSAELTKLNENLAKVEELSTRLVSAVSRKKSVPAALQGPGQDVFVQAAPE